MFFRFFFRRPPLSTSRLLCAISATLGIAILVTLLLSFTKPPVSNKSVLVDTKFGKVLGAIADVYGKDVYSFYGLKFAEAPSKSLRFRGPVPVTRPIQRDNILDVSCDCRPICFQTRFDRRSDEDCLHLNIWTPMVGCDKPSSPSGDSVKTKTVLFFLGGELFQNRVRNVKLDGRFLSSLGDLVVVVPNYRLGVLGFLNARTESAPGNMGLQDQLVALRWTQDHIGSFCGNSSDIVVMGYGSGASSIGYHAFSKTFWPPVTRMILMNESPFTRYVQRGKTYFWYGLTSIRKER